jgi:MFS family permease
MSCPISSSGALALEWPCAPTSASPNTHAAVTRELHTITLIAFLGLLLSGYNNFVAAVAMVGIQPMLHPTPVQTGMVLAATFAGMLLGGATLGHVADRYGRRVAMLLNMSLIALFAIASALVTDPTQLVIMRLLTGVGIGASYPIGASYVADMAPTQHRGAWMTMAFSGWGVGALAAGLTGWLSIELLPLHLAWRVMLASGALPALLTFVIVLLRGLPESAAWHHGRTLESLPARSLLAPPYRRLTLAALLPWFLMDLPVYGVGLLVPTLLTQLRIGGALTVVITTAALSSLTLVGFALAYATIDRLGRRCLQIMGFVGMTVLFALLALQGAHPNVMQLLVLFAAVQVFINAGPNTTTWIVAAELFPTRLRARGQGSATAFSRLGAASGAFFLPVIDAHYGSGAAFALVALASLLAAAITWRLLPETARRALLH